MLRHHIYCIGTWGETNLYKLLDKAEAAGGSPECSWFVRTAARQWDRDLSTYAELPAIVGLLFSRISSYIVICYCRQYV